MSDHFFGVGRGRVSTEATDRLEKIAKKHGSYFVTANIPGDGYRFWFGTRNRGEPFDSSTAKTVLDEATKEGLWPIQ